jgi:hypothetical protein
MTSTYAEELPVPAFGHMPTFQQPTISPRGGFIAAVLNSGASPRIVILDFGRPELRTAIELEPTVTEVEWLQWLGESRLLFQVTGLVGAHDVKRHFIFAIDSNGSNSMEINRVYSQEQYEVLGLLPDEPNHILLQAYDLRTDIATVYKVDTLSGDFKQQFRNRFGVDQWVAGSDGEVSFGLYIRRQPFKSFAWPIRRYLPKRPYWFRARGEQEFTRIDETNLQVEDA